MWETVVGTALAWNISFAIKDVFWHSHLLPLSAAPALLFWVLTTTLGLYLCTHVPLLASVAKPIHHYHASGA